MGRHLKTGLNYFPLDVDFFEDEKVQFISAKFGVKGDGILLRILCKIYRQGYSLKFDEDAALLVARSVGDISLHGLVMDVVYESLKRGIFNNPIFLKFGLLTSKGIQSRYEKICTDSKRKDWQILPELDLIANTTELKAFTPEEIAKTPEESTQSKVKESKVKERKRENTAHPPFFLVPEKRKPPSLLQVQQAFAIAGGTEEMAEKFFNNYESLEWMKDGSQIKVIQGLVNNYVASWKRNDAAKNGKTQTQTPLEKQIEEAHKKHKPSEQFEQ